MKKCLLLVTIVVIVATVCGSVAAATWTGTLNGVGYIRSGNPTINYGGSTLAVGYSANYGQIRRGLAQWDMTSAPGQAAVINAANSVRVGMHQSNATNSGTVASITLSKAAQSWTQAGANWNNASGYVSDYATQTTTSNTDYTWSWNGNQLGVPGQGYGVIARNTSIGTGSLAGKTGEDTGDFAKIFANTPSLSVDWYLDATTAKAANATTNSIKWNWTNVANESGYRLYTGSTLVGNANIEADVTSKTEIGLTANKSYTRNVCSYTALVAGTTTGQETTRVALTATTLSAALGADSVSVATTDSQAFTWTNNIAWGEGGVSSLAYMWDQNATYSFTGSENQWTGGTLSTTAAAGTGTWYLHLMGYNSVGVANSDGTFSYGVAAAPPSVPEPGTILAACSILAPVGFVFRRRRS